jgi:tRNA/rRNA methyltransferase
VSETAGRPSIVLVSPKGADNLGSVARAMKNFGLSDLRVVAPRCRLADAQKMAVHAYDLIERASIFETLLDAVRDLEFVVGTTARERRDHINVLTPRSLMPSLIGQTSAAVVFGREEHGLFNEELDLCHALLRIPTDAAYVSLNLAQAVQVIVYELLLAREQPAAPAVPHTRDTRATRADTEGMYAHLLEFMLEVGYTDSHRQDHALRRFRAILDRSLMTKHDVAFTRGLLSQGLWASRKARGLGVPGSVPYPRPESADLEPAEHALKTALAEEAS